MSESSERAFETKDEQHSNFIQSVLTAESSKGMIVPLVEKGPVGFSSSKVNRRSPRHNFVRVVFLWLSAMGGFLPCRFLLIGLLTRCRPTALLAGGIGLDLQSAGDLP